MGGIFLYYFKNCIGLAIIALGIGILASFFIPPLLLLAIVTIILIILGFAILKY